MVVGVLRDMHNVFVLGTIALTLSIVPVAAAHPNHGEHETTYTSARTKLDDKRDARHLSRILDAWEVAVARSNRRAERRADQALEQWLRREIREEHREDRAALREGVRSNRQYQQKVRRRSPQRSINEQHRTARNDRYNERQERRETQQTLAVARRLMKLQPLFTNGRASAAKYREKHRLLTKLLDLETYEALRGRDGFRKGGKRGTLYPSPRFQRKTTKRLQERGVEDPRRGRAARETSRPSRRRQVRDEQTPDEPNSTYKYRLVTQRYNAAVETRTKNGKYIGLLGDKNTLEGNHSTVTLLAKLRG